MPDHTKMHEARTLLIDMRSWYATHAGLHYTPLLDKVDAFLAEPAPESVLTDDEIEDIRQNDEHHHGGREDHRFDARSFSRAIERAILSKVAAPTRIPKLTKAEKKAYKRARIRTRVLSAKELEGSIK